MTLHKDIFNYSIFFWLETKKGKERKNYICEFNKYNECSDCNTQLRTNIYVTIYNI